MQLRDVVCLGASCRRQSRAKAAGRHFVRPDADRDKPASERVEVRLAAFEGAAADPEAARTPEISESDYQKLLLELTAQGYDLTKLRKVPHRWPDKP